MKNGVRGIIRSIMRMIAEDMRSTSVTFIAVFGAVAALFFLVTAVSAWDDICSCELLLPGLTPPPLITVIFRILTGGTLGSALGFLLGVKTCYCAGGTLRAALAVCLAIPAEMLWLPLVYSVCMPFFALFALVIMGAAAFAALLLLRFRFPAVRTLVFSYGISVLFRFCWCFSVLLIN